MCIWICVKALHPVSYRMHQTNEADLLIRLGELLATAVYFSVTGREQNLGRWEAGAKGIPPPAENRPGGTLGGVDCVYSPKYSPTAACFWFSWA